MATWDRLFRKELNFEKSKSNKMSNFGRKFVEMGFRKMIGGSRKVRKGQNCVPDPLEGLPDLKNQFKNSKKAKKHKNPKNQGFSVFSYFSGVGIHNEFRDNYSESLSEAPVRYGLGSVGSHSSIEGGSL